VGKFFTCVEASFSHFSFVCWRLWCVVQCCSILLDHSVSVLASDGNNVGGKFESGG
jgi:hypothetical protein